VDIALTKHFEELIAQTRSISAANFQHELPPAF